MATNTKVSGKNPPDMEMTTDENLMPSPVIVTTPMIIPITPAVAPHAPYTVPPEWLVKSRELAESEGVPVLMHIAEFAHEKRLTQEQYQSIPEDQSVVEYLEEIGFLSDSLVAAHVIHVDHEDMEILKRHGVGIAHNPKANGRGNTGMSPAWDMFIKDLDIGLGTDGPMGSNQMDVLNVMTHALQ